MAFKVIQGHQGRYQSKDRIRLSYLQWLIVIDIIQPFSCCFFVPGQQNRKPSLKYEFCKKREFLKGDLYNSDNDDDHDDDDDDDSESG